MSDADYTRYQTFFAKKVADLTITTLDNAGTRSAILSPRSVNEVLYVQKISVFPTTYAAVTLTFQDQAAPPVAIGSVSIPAAAPTAGVGYVIDFGPTGTPLTVGKALDLVQAGGGAACRVHIEAYEKLGVSTAA